MNNPGVFTFELDTSAVVAAVVISALLAGVVTYFISWHLLGRDRGLHRFTELVIPLAALIGTLAVGLSVSFQYTAAESQYFSEVFRWSTEGHNLVVNDSEKRSLLRGETVASYDIDADRIITVTLVTLPDGNLRLVRNP